MRTHGHACTTGADWAASGSAWKLCTCMPECSCRCSQALLGKDVHGQVTLACPHLPIVLGHPVPYNPCLKAGCLMPSVHLWLVLPFCCVASRLVASARVVSNLGGGMQGLSSGLHASSNQPKEGPAPPQALIIPAQITFCITCFSALRITG